MAEICDACLHPIRRTWLGRVRPDCPDCDRIAESELKEDIAQDTPCAVNK